MYEKNLMNWEYEQKCMSVAGKCPTWNLWNVGFVVLGYGIP
jgi:hypothetical protein